ncbi:peptidoglycan DD-metalloendopeptidase family protein [Brevibacillus centrosporus]|uniref:LysM peptidoglycan-binding domain-containing M23 family metallopeptidase n=1 Tax=Brevibacillus centrosporus TaxID=54910 RepID=UPI0011436FD2|nr:M23 family metallopeptidase [Brevibacillus centrosporus]MEC2133259.1 peptidoglycan DD-metalloendopeptidase family protein [Brevibacillus centrosporus]GED34787.1 metalloendopeptidase [Brevibacillus centrosporus]
MDSPVTRKSKKCDYYFKKNKKIKLFYGTALLLTTTGFAYAEHVDNSHMVIVYQVELNGKEIGVVSSPTVVQEWLEANLNKGEKQNNVSELELTDRITFKEQKKLNGRYDNEAALEALSKETELEVFAVKVEVGGNIVGYAANQQEIEKALAQLKQRYVGTSSKSSVAAASLNDQRSEVKQVKFKETVSTGKSTAPASEILSSDKLVQVLSNGHSTPIIHTVREGDCLGCIANKYGVKLSDILDNNPDINENSLLLLGQQVKVTVSKPRLTVEVTEEMVKNEVIPYQLETRSSDKLPRGETRVIQPGKEGTKRARYQVIKENGKTVERKLIQEEIVTKPIAKIVERGTKIVSPSDSGNMTWPANGVLTSRYGQRWGRLHKGLDIAGSGSIRATESGKVVLSGWYGDYGKAVIIDHGNGVQTLYGHMKSLRVSEGEQVSKGTAIGIMGSTGDSTGIHVHFEVRKGGQVQNPMNYLKR